MATKIHAPKVRHLLAQMISNLPSEGMTTVKIIAAMRTKHPEIIAAETPDLVEVALTRIVSQTGGRNSNATPNVTPDLFGEYGIQPTLFVFAKTGQEKILKNIGDVTVAEAERYVSKHRKPSTKLPKKVAELGRLAQDAKQSGAKPEDKIGEWWGQRKKDRSSER